MAVTVIPYIPEYITVHLGTPQSNAENVTVSFPDYVKNVASSEIYPTWEPAAIRANILAIISFALNRVYTEFYPSQGYSFNITSSTAYDQKFINGRNIFNSIERVVDEIFTTYIRRIGFVEPLSSKFCNGTTTICDGLSQWGSQELAQEGYNSVDILRHYYGDDIELVTNAQIQNIQYSYPGYPLRQGDYGESVGQLQTMLNQVARDYPAIPKVRPVDGVFGSETEKSVVKFQEVFNLVPDGIVGKGTWYRLVYLYVGILDLSELISEGQTFYASQLPIPNDGQLTLGSQGDEVKIIQYLLRMVAEFYSEVPAVAVDGRYGPNTQTSVKAFQRREGLPQTGAVDAATWDALSRAYEGTRTTLVAEGVLMPLSSIVTNQPVNQGGSL